MQSDEITHIKKRAFLAAYAECGNVTQAAEISDVDRSSHYRWIREDVTYADAFEDAGLAAGDRLEQEARRRAVDGVDEPVYYKGKKCGVVRKYSDTLLIFMLKGAIPDKYKDRVQTDVTLNPGELTPDQADALIRAYKP